MIGYIPMPFNAMRHIPTFRVEIIHFTYPQPIRQEYGMMMLLVFQITIVPPFYKQWWFNMLLFLALAIILLSLYQRNVEKHKRIIREQALKRENELTERRNQELKSGIASNTILLLNKNESLEQIRSKLVELKSTPDNYSNINDLIKLFDNQMDVDVYWEQFQYNFDQVYQNMLTRL